MRTAERKFAQSRWRHITLVETSIMRDKNLLLKFASKHQRTRVKVELRKIDDSTRIYLTNEIRENSCKNGLPIFQGSSP